MDDVHIEYMALGELLQRQHPSNPKDHSIDSIVRSIERFGYVTPGTIDERTGYFAEGHGRTKALAWMKQQGREPPARIDKRKDDWYVPVYRGVSFNSDSELKAFLVAANRLTILGGWNEPELAGLLQDLAAQDTALLEATGYDGDDLQALLDELTPVMPATDPGAQIDRAAELQAEWQVVRGQVWAIPSKAGKGEHRLMCGDSTSAEDVARLMDGAKAAMVWTDPPYGMNLDTDFEAMSIRSTKVKGKRYDAVVGDNAPFDWGAVQTPQCQEQFWWGADYYCQQLPQGGSWFVWDKRVGVIDDAIGNMFELCWSAKLHRREIIRMLWSGVTAKERGEVRAHPTQKPVALAAQFIAQFCSSGDVVWDGFTGSGTTLVACEQTGRIGFGMEIEPKYCAVTLQRLSDIGLTPRLVNDDGRTP